MEHKRFCSHFVFQATASAETMARDSPLQTKITTSTKRATVLNNMPEGGGTRIVPIVRWHPNTALTAKTGYSGTPGRRCTIISGMPPWKWEEFWLEIQSDVGHNRRRQSTSLVTSFVNTLYEIFINVMNINWMIPLFTECLTELLAMSDANKRYTNQVDSMTSPYWYEPFKGRCTVKLPL